MDGTLEIGFGDLTPKNVWKTATDLSKGPYDFVRVSISLEARRRIAASAEVVQKASEAGQPVYGLNTGVGALRHVVIDNAHLRRMQVNLVRSHACGVGEPLSRAMVAAMWILFLNSAAHGHKGVRLETIDAIMTLLNNGVFRPRLVAGQRRRVW